MKLAMVVLLGLLSAPAALAQQTAPEIPVREDFHSLDNWTPLTFPKIKTHSTYTIEHEGSATVLRAESNASASAIVYKKDFDVYRYPKARWRWKVRNVYRNADATSRQGDDFPIRIYVLFAYEPDKAGFGEAIKYGFAKSLYGEYPPHSSLNYVWSSKEHPERIITNPYSDRAKDILLRKGPALVGTWQDEEVDLLADYEAAFGVLPPRKARIAIMNDSDNTGEAAVSWVADLEVFK